MAPEAGTILIGSRDDRFVRFFDSVSERLGLKLVVSDTGKKMLACLSDHDTPVPRIVVLDEDLVDMRGRSLIGPIHAMDEDVRIIFAGAAGESLEQLEVEVRRLGVHFFMVKPLDEKVLERLIERVLTHETTRLSRYKTMESYTHAG